MPSHETVIALCLQPLTTHNYQVKDINRHQDALYTVGEYCLLEPNDRILILPCPFIFHHVPSFCPYGQAVHVSYVK